MYIRRDDKDVLCGSKAENLKQERLGKYKVIYNFLYIIRNNRRREK